MDESFSTFLRHRKIFDFGLDVIEPPQKFGRRIVIVVEIASHRNENKFRDRPNRVTKLEADICCVKRFLIDCLESLTQNAIKLVTLQKEALTRFAVIMSVNQS